jgi:hypothetical protein
MANNGAERRLWNASEGAGAPPQWVHAVSDEKPRRDPLVLDEL